MFSLENRKMFSCLVLAGKQKSVLPKEQELIPEYCRPSIRPCVRACVCPPTDKRRVCILCLKQHIYVVF
jgi:hypothetical protein